ncbi:hypothetical protein PBI_DUKE13_190 [Mycobacterium phage Duke13]|uniref:Uncharacterized protein n=1 Tax=Mycobacterium phage Duke13 TaxID=2499038 RepID=A0A3S9UB75_9CAUD|nr:hypothetical protein PBI_DUKE13_190 [Mycobacterium phage Duke13]
MSVYDEAVQLLRDNIGSLPDDEFGHLNLFPFSYESDETNGLKLKVCMSIAKLLQNSGLLASDEAAPAVSKSVRVSCSSCDTTLLSTVVSETGGAPVPAAAVISSLSKMDTACPHKVMTLDDQRKMIQQAIEGAGNE